MRSLKDGLLSESSASIRVSAVFLFHPSFQCCYGVLLIYSHGRHRWPTYEMPFALFRYSTCVHYSRVSSSTIHLIIETPFQDSIAMI